ncbi:MAG: carbon-nitrogen hydrolase family protein [FCB group bacterium]|jgi:N-carbamoylputrescine amidase|nr:carbon-nitrogen hydrolase family protein [FCB group bacterium]
MLAALLVPRITADAKANLATIERMAGEAVASGAALLVFPETVVTGFANNDDPTHDLPLGQTIPGPATNRLGGFCARHGVWLVFGLFEREEDRLYDAAVLLGPDGGVHLKYRRNHSHWHARDADPTVYCQGTEIEAVDTPFGRIGFLICGDIYDDTIAARFRALEADWLVHCLARSFEDDEARWHVEELPKYAARVKLAQTPTLMVNYFGDPSFIDDESIGGAYVFSADGEVMASYPLFTEGMLLAELDGV